MCECFTVSVTIYSMVIFFICVLLEITESVSEHWKLCVCYTFNLSRVYHSIGSPEQPCKRQEAWGRNIAGPSRPCALRSRRALGGPRPWRSPLSRGATVPRKLGAWHAERLPRGHARWHLRRVDSSPVALLRGPRKVRPKRGGWTTHKRRMPAGMRQVVACRLLLGYRGRRLWRRQRRRR